MLDMSADANEAPEGRTAPGNIYVSKVRWVKNSTFFPWTEARMGDVHEGSRQDVHGPRRVALLDFSGINLTPSHPQPRHASEHLTAPSSSVVLLEMRGFPALNSDTP